MEQINVELRALLELAIQKVGKNKVEKTLKNLISKQKMGRPDIIDFIIENANRKEQPAGIIIAASTVKNLSRASWYRLKQRRGEIPEEIWRELENVWDAKMNGEELEILARLYMKYH